MRQTRKKVLQSHCCSPPPPGPPPRQQLRLLSSPFLLTNSCSFSSKTPEQPTCGAGDSGRQPDGQPAPGARPRRASAGLTPPLPDPLSPLLPAATGSSGPRHPRGTPRGGDCRRYFCPPPRGHLPGSGSAAPRGGRASAGTDLPFWRGSSGARAFLPLVSSSEGKGESVSRGKEKTQRPKPLAPAELEELVSRSPSFRSVSDFFFFFPPLCRYL